MRCSRAACGSATCWNDGKQELAALWPQHHGRDPGRRRHRLQQPDRLHQRAAPLLRRVQSRSSEAGPDEMPELPEVRNDAPGHRAPGSSAGGSRASRCARVAAALARAARPPGEARGQAHPRGRPARQVPAHRHRGRHAHLASRDVGEPQDPRRRGACARARSRGSRARFGTMPAVQRPAPLRLPPVHDRRSRTPQAARGPRGRAALRRFQRRCRSGAARARAAHVHQGLHHGFARRRRRRQHLCERGALSRGHPAGPCSRGASAARAWRRSSNQFARC